MPRKYQRSTLSHGPVDVRLDSFNPQYNPAHHPRIMQVRGRHPAPRFWINKRRKATKRHAGLEEEPVKAWVRPENSTATTLNADDDHLDDNSSVGEAGEGAVARKRQRDKRLNIAECGHRKVYSSGSNRGGRAGCKPQLMGLHVMEVKRMVESLGVATGEVEDRGIEM